MPVAAYAVIADPTLNSEPLNVRLASSSSSPPTPTTTIRLSVRSSTFAVVASIPPFASIKPEAVMPPTKKLGEYKSVLNSIREFALFQVRVLSPALP